MKPAGLAAGMAATAALGALPSAVAADGIRVPLPGGGGLSLGTGEPSAPPCIALGLQLPGQPTTQLLHLGDGACAPPAGDPAPPTGDPAAPAPPGDGAADPSTAAPEVVRHRKQRRTTDRRTARGGGSAGNTRARSRRSAAHGGVPDAGPEPTPVDPTFSYVLPGPVSIGVPSFFIDRFRIPPFLLPIYQAAGIEYGVRWELLAAINEIETDYGRNLNVSTAGAVGWMQFMPSTWKRYGTDANVDGHHDPYNPVDAIFSAARYLKAAGADTDVRKALFAYNHADWYVDSVLMRARLIAGLPADLVGSLSGLTAGRFPVAAAARYAEQRVPEGGHAHDVDIFARAGAAAVAVQDAKVIALGRTERLGRYVRLRDVYGNTYTYAHLRRIAAGYPVRGAPPRRRVSAAKLATIAVAPAKERVFANPAAAVRGARRTVPMRALRAGSRVPGGTVLGRLGGATPHLRFTIRPASDPTHPAPLIDPKPILDGWKLLESTAIYRAAGRNPLLGGDRASVGQVLLMGKDALQRRILEDPRIELDPAGRTDVRTGAVDRRVLATLAFLSASGLRPTVSVLKTGHSRLTSAGNVSEHASGNAVDVSAINGVPIAGHQGAGSITDITIRRLLTLQGTLKPHQIISLMSFAGVDNTLALPDHADHIHIGFRPLYTGDVRLGRQWDRLVARLRSIKLPAVRTSAPG